MFGTATENGIGARLMETKNNSTDTTKQPTYQDYLQTGFIPVLCKGDHPKYNPERDYAMAKIPAFRDWNSPNHTPPTLPEIEAWKEDGGWTGWIPPKGVIVLDVDKGQDDIDRVREICRARRIGPGVHRSNYGSHFCFATDRDLPAASRVFVKCGLDVTYRVAGKNQVIFAPINGRTWEAWKERQDLPMLPDDFLPYNRNNLDDVLNCLSWQTGKAYRAGHFSGYEGLDAAFMALLVQCKLSEQEVHHAFETIFGQDYDEGQTDTMYDRTRSRMENGDPVIGAGTFMQQVNEQKLDKIKRFAQELQRLLAASRGSTTSDHSDCSYGSYGSYGYLDNDCDIIKPAPFPIEVFPPPFERLIETYARAQQVERELIALMMTGVISGAIGNTITVSVKNGWENPLFMWIMYVAEAGSGKSPAQSAVLKPVKRLQARATDRYNVELKEYYEVQGKAKKDESIVIPDQPRAVQRLVSDITIESLADCFENDGRGAIYDKDELSSLVRSFNQYRRGGDDRQKYLSLFNCNTVHLT
jgi:hypothetical protein